MGAGGQVVAGATVVLHTYDAEKKTYTRVADGRTDDVGRFQLTTYARFDGAPADNYAVTITKVVSSLSRCVSRWWRSPRSPTWESVSHSLSRGVLVPEQDASWR